MQYLEVISVYALPLLLAITLHEAAHAYAARMFGDSTAFMLGRMTLNPAKHIDPIWTIVVPVVTLLLTPFVFGAAKPVPVNTSALRNPHRDMAWVAGAGPGANLAMMIGWAIVLKLVLIMPTSLPVAFVREMASAGIVVNALLMVFNLFPILPLDGGRILAAMLPRRWAVEFARLEPFGMIILLVMLLTGVLSSWLLPAVQAVQNTVYFFVT